MTNPWSAIEKPSSDLNVRLVDETHPLKLFWGVDSQLLTPCRQINPSPAYPE